MFGIVPKAIWSKLAPADDPNRIRQNENALFIDLDDGRKGLTDEWPLMTARAATWRWRSGRDNVWRQTH